MSASEMAELTERAKKQKAQDPSIVVGTNHITFDEEMTRRIYEYYLNGVVMKQAVYVTKVVRDKQFGIMTAYFVPKKVGED